MPGTASGGRLILVVGASGAGKDTLVQWARRTLPKELPLRFFDLEITRTPRAWERHTEVSREDFEARRARGAYVLDWEAHESSYGYGVPEAARAVLEEGLSVVTIGSRAAVGVARTLAWECRVLEIRAPFEVLRQRLLARGRENETEIDARLARASQIEVSGDVTVIDNGGALESSGAAFNEALTRLSTDP